MLDVLFLIYGNACFENQWAATTYTFDSFKFIFFDSVNKLLCFWPTIKPSTSLSDDKRLPHLPKCTMQLRKAKSIAINQASLL